MSFQGFEERSSMVVTACDAAKISVGVSVASGILKTRLSLFAYTLSTSRGEL